MWKITTRCVYIIEKTEDFADDVTVIQGVSSGSVEDTWKDDNQFYSVNEKLLSNGGYALDFYFDFYNVSLIQNYTGMTIYWIGRWDSPEEDVYIELWDWCNNNWTNSLPNTISTNTPIVSNFLSKDDWNLSCLINQTDAGTVRVRFRDKDWSEKEVAGTLDTDYIVVQINYATYGEYNEIRGGGEIHINKRIEEQIGEGNVQVIVVS